MGSDGHDVWHSVHWITATAVKNSSTFGRKLVGMNDNSKSNVPLIWAHMQLGRVSQADYDIVASIANPTSVTKERVSEIEAETRHDIMALTKAMAEAAGEMRVGASTSVPPPMISWTQPSPSNCATAS